MEYAESGYWVSGYVYGDIVAGENTGSSLYVEAGYHAEGYIDGDTQAQAESGLYVESGYHAEGYIDGDTTTTDEPTEGPTPSITSTLNFRIDVKKTSTKTKEEVLLIAKAEVETRQGWYENRVVYADVYDVRDKTITRVFSDLAKANGFADEDNAAFGGDIEQITSITSAIDQNASDALAAAQSAVSTAGEALSVAEGAKKPRLKLVNPFEALTLDTQMTNNNGVYSFAFDTTQIGNGTYHLEVEFVDEDV